MRAAARLGLAIGLLLCAPAAPAALELSAVRAERTAQTVALSLELELRDPGGRVARALLRGDVWLTVDLVLHRTGRWWQEARPVGRLRLLRRLAYEPLRQAYRVHDVNRGERTDFDDLGAALARLLRLRAVPAARLDRLPGAPAEFRGEARARLHANPAPMELALDPEREAPLDWRSGAVRWRLP